MLQRALTSRRWVIRVGEWALLFVVLLLAIWISSQNLAAPQLILLALLYIITINFSLPPEQSGVGLVPLVAISSLLVLGLNTAVFLALISFILAELVSPLWHSIWEQVGVSRPSRSQRLAAALTHLLPLWLAGLIYQQVGGPAPLTTATTENLVSFGWLAFSFGVFHFLLAMAWWLWRRRPLAIFFKDNTLAVSMSGLLAQPMAILGGITFAQSGLPVFVVFCLGVMIFSTIIWLSWQRRYVLEQQYAQFALLNDASASLRETLDLTAVLQSTYYLVTELIAADSFTIALLEDGVWQRPFQDSPAAEAAFQPDDFMGWVAEQKRPLYVEERDLHFAARHQLTVPSPPPAAWLGMPLMAANQFMGVMVLQRFTPGQAFNRWQQELLLAVVGQASAAIQNARLYDETVRLYNLTDEALAQRVKQLQALLDSIQEGVLMLDRSGRMALINPMAAGLLGQPPAALGQQPIEPALAPAIGYGYQTLTQLLGRLQSGDLPEPHKTAFDLGTRHIIRLEAPVYAANQQAIGWLMLFRDVTEEVQLAEQRADLTRMIVHDLRNPITTLISTLGLAQAQLNGMAVETILDDAQQGCLDMLDMVDSLMDMTRLEAGQMVIEAEAIYLQPLIERLVSRLQPLATQRSIELSYTFVPSLPVVWADEEMMRRVLINLLDNALKFTPAHGRIYIDLRPEPPASMQAAEPGLRCSVQDNGPGIPPEYHQQVFNRFMRTNAGGAQVRGTGLGLAFCKMAIEAHKGRIWVEASRDGGSQFIFTLPGMPLMVREAI